MRLTETRGDGVAGVLFAAFAGYLYWRTASMPPQAAKYPLLLEAIFAITSLALVLRSATRMRRHRPGADHSLFSGIAWRPLAAVVVVWLLAIAALWVVGLYATFAVMTGAIAWLLDNGASSARRVLRAGLFGAASALAFWLIFDRGLGVIAPAGWLF